MPAVRAAVALAAAAVLLAACDGGEASPAATATAEAGPPVARADAILLMLQHAAANRIVGGSQTAGGPPSAPYVEYGAYMALRLVAEPREVRNGGEFVARFMFAAHNAPETFTFAGEDVADADWNACRSAAFHAGRIFLDQGMPLSSVLVAEPLLASWVPPGNPVEGEWVSVFALSADAAPLLRSPHFNFKLQFVDGQWHIIDSAWPISLMPSTR